MNKMKLSRLPFTTHYQEKAQKIIKELWKESEIFLTNFAKSWLHQQVIVNYNKETPTILIYHTIENNDKLITYNIDDENIENKNFNIEIVNFEKFFSYSEDTKVNVRGINDKNIIGISLIAIMDLLKPHYHIVAELHKNIIKISQTGLNQETQKYFIEKAVEDVETYLNEHCFELNFSYPADILRDLNDIYSNYDWVSSFDIFLAIEAYQNIIYFKQWIDKHKIEEKRYKEKKSSIYSNYSELIEYMNILPPYAYASLPRHPQDILQGLASNYYSFSGREKKMKDIGVQTIIEIISDYTERMPKKSKEQKRMELEQHIKMQIVGRMRHHKATDEEITNFIIFWDIEEKMLKKIINDLKEYFLTEIKPQIDKMELNKNTENKAIALFIDTVFGCKKKSN